MTVEQHKEVADTHDQQDQTSADRPGSLHGAASRVRRPTVCHVASLSLKALATPERAPSLSNSHGYAAGSVTATKRARNPAFMLPFMSDDDGPSRQIAAYGATAQPAIAARMTRHLRLTLIGTACAVLGVVAAAAAVAMFPSFAGAGPGLAWAVGALISAALMLIICLIQVVVWRRAMASRSRVRPCRSCMRAAGPRGSPTT